MKKIVRTILILAFLGTGITASAQNSKARVVKIETVKITAKVVGILEGHKSLAVLQVLEADSGNAYDLEPAEEVLTEFYFGTAPTDGDPKLPGLSGGEVIVARIAGKPNPDTGQYDYRVFEYWLQPKGSSSSRGDTSPQK